MIDLALDNAGDLADFVIGGSTISGLPRVAQELRIRLLTHLREWFLDSRIGLDWTSWIERKAASNLLREIEVTISREVLATNSVTQITERVTAIWEQATRTIRISFACLAAELGEVVTAVTVDGAGAVMIILLGPTGAIIP